MNVNGQLTRAQLENLSSDPTPGLFGRMFWNTALGKPRVDNGTSIQDLGGSNAGGINYVTNPDAEAGTTGWATYADSAGAAPVDGTGGSPAATLTRVTSSPLRGLGMFRITKDAVNRQGNGVSYDFTIAAADKGHMLSVSFEYAVSAAFVSGDSSDIRAWIYDVTNGALIPLTPFTIQGGTGLNNKFAAQFQTASNSTSYRLILHIATTNASAWTFDFDSVVVSPTSFVYAAPVSDWQTFSPVATWTTNTTTTGRWRRVGDSMELDVTLTLSGAPDSTALVISLPSGYSIDTTKMSVSTQYNKGFGAAALRDASASFFCGIVRYNSATTLVVTPENNGVITQLIPYTWATGDALSFVVSVPILGWSSNLQVSNDASTRVVLARYTAASTGNTPNSETVFNFSTKSIDTHNAVAVGASWAFTVPVSGFYQVSSSIAVSGSAINSFTMAVRKNATDYKLVTVPQEVASSFSRSVSLSAVVQCVAGDTLDVTFYEGVDNSVFLASPGQEISIQRVSGPSSIAAVEVIAASYTSAATTSMTGTPAIVDFETKLIDTHGAVTTGSSWKFTAPVSGIYQVSACALLSNGTNVVNSSATLGLYKNGSLFFVFGISVMQTTGAVSPFASGAGLIKLLAGDTIAIKCSQSSGNVFALTGTNTNIHISRVGNYA